MKCSRCGRDYPSEYYFEETPEGLLCAECVGHKSEADEAASVESRIARRVRRAVGHSGGREGQMSGLAGFLLVLGILGFTATVIISVATGSVAALPLGLLVLIQGVALYVVLQGGAEAIRLLKKLNQLPYGGTISVPRSEEGDVCSACGARVWPQSTRCPGCGSRLED